MSKQSYIMRTSSGPKRMDVEADPEVHEQLVAVLKGLGKLRELYAELDGIKNQVVQTKGWLESAIDKTELKPFFDKELL